MRLSGSCVNVFCAIEDRSQMNRWGTLYFRVSNVSVLDLRGFRSKLHVYTFYQDQSDINLYFRSVFLSSLYFVALLYYLEEAHYVSVYNPQINVIKYCFIMSCM